MHLGVWINGAPETLESTEGMLRLFSFFMPPLLKEGLKITLLTPLGGDKALEKWAAEFDLDNHPGLAFRSSSLPWDSPLEVSARADVGAEIAADVWTVLRIDHADPKHIDAPWCGFFADFLLRDFPLLYPRPVYAEVFERMSSLGPEYHRLITFSNYVADKHGVEALKLDRKKMRVAPHAPVDYIKYNEKAFTKELGYTPNNYKDLDRGAAANILRDWLRSNVLYFDKLGQDQLQTYTANYPFEDVDLIFCSTQPRRHKNLSVLVDSVTDLIRNKYAPIKLMLSSVVVYEEQYPLSAQIMSKCIHNDVFSLHHTPSHIHACLYRLAGVTVHPSPFEGGLPFPFSESLSMGTPIIMAKGPVNAEFLSPGEVSAYCFEPSSATDLSRRIEAVLSNRDEYLAMQLETLEKQKKRRNWSDVAREYTLAFKEAKQSYEIDYWRRSDALQKRIAHASSGTVAGADFLANATLKNITPLCEQYIPGDFSGTLKLTLRFDKFPYEATEMFLASSLRWVGEEIAYYENPQVHVEQQDSGRTEISFTFLFPQDDLGKVKELRMYWAGLGKAVLESISWDVEPSEVDPDQDPVPVNGTAAQHADSPRPADLKKSSLANSVYGRAMRYAARLKGKPRD